MPPKKKSCDHFGGRTADQIGALPFEADFNSWAGFSPSQAQAYLIEQRPQLYDTKDSKSSLVCNKDLLGAAVKRHCKGLSNTDDQWITVLKLAVNPMQLVVQHQFCKAKGIEFSPTAWAVELFGLREKKALDKLQQYLHLKEVKDTITAIETLSHAEQLDKAVELAARIGGEHIEQLLRCMDAIDIQGAATQPADSAELVMQLLKQGRPHAMPLWRGNAAAQHLSRFLGSLALEPHQETDILAAVITSCDASCNYNKYTHEGTFSPAKLGEVIMSSSRSSVK